MSKGFEEFSCRQVHLPAPLTQQKEWHILMKSSAVPSKTFWHFLRAAPSITMPELLCSRDLKSSPVAKFIHLTPLPAKIIAHVSEHIITHLHRTVRVRSRWLRPVLPRR